MTLVEKKMTLVAALILIQYMISLIRAGRLTGSVFRPDLSGAALKVPPFEIRRGGGWCEKKTENKKNKKMKNDTRERTRRTVTDEMKDEKMRRGEN